MTIRAGRLRSRLQIYKESSSTERDDYGVPIKVKELVGTYWCEANHESDVTLEGGELHQNQSTVKFTTRYNKFLGEISNDMYISFGGNEYDINSVINPRLLNEYLIITALLRG